MKNASEFTALLGFIVVLSIGKHFCQALFRPVKGIRIDIHRIQFGEDLLDVITQGELIAKGQPVRIIGCSGTEVIVEPVESDDGSTTPVNRGAL